MHHGIVEHFMGESVIFPDYLVDDRFLRADELMQAGLKVSIHGSVSMAMMPWNLPLADCF